jgi:hypothetical protein
MTTKDGPTFEIELLTPEQRKKVSIVGEALDTKGIVRIFKVKDQTIFDYLYMLDMIDTAQHEAAHRYLEALEKSGVYISSVDIEAVSNTPSYMVGEKLADRWLAFSMANRFVIRECGEAGADALIRISDDPYSKPESKHRLELIVRAISEPLKELARFYQCKKSDPRKKANGKGGR